MLTSNAYAIDFETVYSTDVSVKIMPTWNYVFHPEAVPYLVAVHSDDFHWVGAPEDFSWQTLHGKTLIAHNAHFDGLVWQRLQKDKVIPASVQPAGWLDTADLVAYLRYPRSLAEASRVVLDTKMDKGIRDRAKGKSVAQMKAEGWWPEMVTYGGGDAVACWNLAKKLLDQWPLDERLVSSLSRDACWRGFQVDRALATQYKALLDTYLWEIEKDIPWDWSDCKTPLSIVAIRKACQTAGISTPASFAKDSVDCAKWEQQHCNSLPWVRSIRYWRRVAFIRAKVLQLLRGCDENGIYHYDMRYCGADTGRYAAGEGKGNSDRFTVHGLARFPIYLNLKSGGFHDGSVGPLPNPDGFEAVDVRKLLHARAGHTFLIWDLAQIEPRLVHRLTANTELLERIRSRGISVYQAEAETSYGWSGTDLKKEDPALYQFIKTAYLGGQYQCGWSKLQVIAHKAGLELTDAQAKDTINTFREKNPRIVALWNRLNTAVRDSQIAKETFGLKLPSGRTLTYHNLQFKNVEGMPYKEFVGEYLKGDSLSRIYGGSLTNNLIQATGRDVLVTKALELYRAGFNWPLWTVHDEGINEVPEEMAKDLPKLKQIVETELTWLPGLPLKAEVVCSPHYLK